MTAEKASRRIEIIAGLVIMAGGIAGFFAVPYLVSGWAIAIPGLTDASLSPTFFPRVAMVAVVLAGLGVVLTARQRDDVLPVVEISGEGWRRATFAAANVVLYATFLPIFGFVASSTLFIIGMAVSAGYRRMLIVIPTAILFPLVTAYIFRWGLRVLLPSGAFW